MFRFGFDKRFMYILLGALLLSTLMSSSQAELMALLLTLPAVIIAITFHEYAHALAADKLGDDTPRMQGRLNLNPMSHIDPVGFMLLMFAGFGWGKPVQINPRNFNRNVRMDRGEAIVSVAGPLMNFVIAIVIAIISMIIYEISSMEFWYSSLGTIIDLLLITIIRINIGLGVFNLIPLPPLDGSKIFINFMPYNWRRKILENSPIFYYIFLAIWITGLAGVIISPIIDLLYSGLMTGVSAIFRLF